MALLHGAGSNRLASPTAQPGKLGIRVRGEHACSERVSPQPLAQILGRALAQHVEDVVAAFYRAHPNHPASESGPKLETSFTMAIKP